MRMSCNGCRVLRKGCSDSCTLRPCLEWIRSAEAQANATVFLAKFYGRSGLMKLLNSGPNHLKPIIFRSLLYEACGRMVNPIYGSVGLQWSGNWDVCQAAVESVLKGKHLQMQEENLESYVPLNISESSDIKPSLSQLTDSTFTDKPLKAKNPGRFKRPLRRKSRTHGDKLTVTTYSQEFESMFQIVEEGDAMKSCNNNQSVLGEASEIQPGQEAFEEIFHKNISDMENFSDDSHSRDMNENGVELELRLGSPVSQETGPPHHFAECKSHWSSMSSCKDPSLLNMASLSLALNHPV